jgi:hypothetical protein
LQLRILHVNQAPEKLAKSKPKSDVLGVTRASFG